MKKLIFVLFTMGILLQGWQAAAEELVVYSGRKSKLIKPILDSFSYYSGIKIKLQKGSSSYFVNLMSMQLENTPADVYFSTDAGNLERGSSLDLFQPIPASIANTIPAQMRAVDNTWLGLSGRSRVLVVNAKSPYANSIKSVLDLANPKLFNRIAITKSQNESFIGGVTVYRRNIGDEKTLQWLKQLKHNTDRKFYKKHSHIVKAVAKGEKDVGLVNHYYIYRYLAKHPDAPLKVILPDQRANGIGVAWNVSGVAISRYTKKTKLAHKLVAYMVSKEVQEHFAKLNREYPLRPGISSIKMIPAIDSYRISNTRMIDLGMYRESTIKLINLAGMP